MCYNGRVAISRKKCVAEKSVEDVNETGGGLTASDVRRASGLTALETEWRALAASCHTATIFQTWEWNAAWWKHFGRVPGRALRVVTFREGDGALVGLAPLMTSFWYATPLRRLSFLGTGTSDYLDLLALPGREQEVARALYDYLEKSGGWQVADFQQLREGGLFRGQGVPEGSPLTALDAAGEACPYLALPETWDMLLQGLGKKTRANVGYYDRGLQKVYTVDAAPVSTLDALDDEMSRLFDLHQRRWNQRWLPGVFGGRRVQAFHRDAAGRLLERGWLRLFSLKLDGVTQASLYCFAYGDRMCYYQGGFEPTLARMSLGTVLTARALQAAVGEGRAVFDFLRGDEPYKAKWTGATRTNARRLITRTGSPLTAIVQRVQGWEDTIERRGKAWMRRKQG